MNQTVLFTASTYRHIQSFHLPYLRAFRALGWQVHVGCAQAPDILPEADRLLHLPFTKSMWAPSNFQAAHQLGRVFHREHYDLVVCHTSLAAFFTRLALLGRKDRPRVVNMVHGYLFDGDTPAWKRRMLLGAEQLTAPVTDLLLTMNHWDHQLASRYRLGREVAPIPGIGIDFSRLSQPASRQAARQTLDIPEEVYTYIFAAEFSGRKDQQTLLRALAQLPEQIWLLLPGDGALLDQCRQLARELGIDHRVRFPGRVEDMPLWYGAADAAVSSSRSEGLPFNILEAMQVGLPVAATAVKGHQDLIAHGLTGLLFPYGDGQACANQLGRLFQDRGLCRQLVQNARESLHQYELSAVLPQVMALYGAPVPAFTGAGASSASLV